MKNWRSPHNPSGYCSSHGVCGGLRGLSGLSIPNISVFSHQDEWGTWKWICSYVAPIIAGDSNLFLFLFFLFDPSADGQVDRLACRAYLVLVYTWGTPLR
jgi:hypothetical protein